MEGGVTVLGLTGKLNSQVSKNTASGQVMSQERTGSDYPLAGIDFCCQVWIFYCIFSQELMSLYSHDFYDITIWEKSVCVLSRATSGSSTKCTWNLNRSIAMALQI